MRPDMSWTWTKLALPITAPAHDPPGDPHPDGQRLQLLGRPATVLGVELARDDVAPEVVRKGDALLAQPGELLAALRDELVLVEVVMSSVMTRCGVWCGSGLSSQALLEARFDERVQPAVEHCLGVADLYLGPQVLDARLVQHVGRIWLPQPTSDLLSSRTCCAALRFWISSS